MNSYNYEAKKRHLVRTSVAFLSDVLQRLPSLSMCSRSCAAVIELCMSEACIRIMSVNFDLGDKPANMTPRPSFTNSRVI